MKEDKVREDRIREERILKDLPTKQFIHKNSSKKIKQQNSSKDNSKENRKDIIKKQKDEILSNLMKIQSFASEKETNPNSSKYYIPGTFFL